MKKCQQDIDFKTDLGELTRKLKSICHVLKEMKLDKKTLKVIAKNASKGKNRCRVPAELTLEDVLGLANKN